MKSIKYLAFFLPFCVDSAKASQPEPVKSIIKNEKELRDEMLKVFHEFLSPENPNKKVKDYAQTIEEICKKNPQFWKNHQQFCQRLSKLNSAGRIALFNLYQSINDKDTKNEITKILHDTAKRTIALESLKKRLV